MKNKLKNIIIFIYKCFAYCSIICTLFFAVTMVINNIILLNEAYTTDKLFNRLPKSEEYQFLIAIFLKILILIIGGYSLYKKNYILMIIVSIIGFHIITNISIYFPEIQRQSLIESCLLYKEDCQFLDKEALNIISNIQQNLKNSINK